MDPRLIIGSLAATLTTVAFLPQVIKAHETKHTKDLSLIMYVLLAIGLVLWTVYGLFLASLPIILANTVTLVLCFYLLYLKAKYG
ncbi:MAG: SemiSWEET transporter [Candidatus Margulisbacteria bacterium]|nr:SemiSWEET transporter [Candidatus Margulisiibacteriota bacterium]